MDITIARCKELIVLRDCEALVKFLDENVNNNNRTDWSDTHMNILVPTVPVLSIPIR